MGAAEPKSNNRGSGAEPRNYTWNPALPIWPMERPMAKKPQDHAGSGIDKPDPKTLVEKIGDRLGKIVPEKPPQQDPPEVAPTIVPPAD